MGKGNGGGGGFFAGFLVGALIGGTAAILLTQEEARERLAGKARDAMDATGDLRGKVGDVTAQWQSSVSELYERGRQVVESARANIDAAVSEGRAAADETAQELHRKAED